MSKGTFQQVIIIGNVGSDPEVRYMPNGNAAANFTLATTESWRDQQGNQQEKTEWHRCSAFRKLAEIIGEYVRKGAKIQIVGKLQTREWQDQQGQKRYTTEIVCHEMQMLDRQQQGQNQQQPQQNNQRQQQAQQPQNNGYSQARQQPMQNQQSNQDPPFGFDSDIPF